MKPYLIIQIRRPSGKSGPIEENATGTDIWYDITVLTEEALERRQFKRDWKDEGYGYEYSYLNLYGDKVGNDDE